MVSDGNLHRLESSADKARLSLLSLDELLACARQSALGDSVEPSALRKIQKQALLESFAVKKFHRDYKEWENSARSHFVNSEVRAYNQKYAQISRLHTDSSDLEGTLQDLRTAILLPAFKFSIQTLQEYENGELLQHIEKDSNGEYPRTVNTDQIFSLESNSTLPHPTYQQFNRLVNIEYRLRMQLQIKYEVLLRVKASLAAKNSQWATRDSSLNKFITTDLPKVIEEVARIKTREYEDLKYYESDFDMEDDGEDLTESGTEDVHEDEENQKEPSIEPPAGDDDNLEETNREEEVTEQENSEPREETIDATEDNDVDDQDAENAGEDGENAVETEREDSQTPAGHEPEADEPAPTSAEDMILD